jgi:predicted nuclease of predicted toxin-antitoxin system
VRPKYLLDEQISPRAAEALGKLGVDAEAVAGSAFAGLDDRAIFRHAIEAGRVLVTYDIQDMSLLLGDFIRAGTAVPGVVFAGTRTLPTNDLVGLARALARLADLEDRGEVNPSGGIFLSR